MSYICEIHGTLDSEWCDGCGKIISCCCENIEVSRIKDLFYETTTGTKTITLYIHHCDTCGRVFKLTDGVTL